MCVNSEDRPEWPQRPLDPRMLPETARPFFQVGEFVGWIVEAPEV